MTSARRYLAPLATLLLAFLVLSFLPPVCVRHVPAPKNAIEAENCLPGTPASQWYVDGAGSPNIQGFTTDIQCDRGQTIFFQNLHTAASYRIDIYRLGFYQGNDGRFRNFHLALGASAANSTFLSHRQFDWPGRLRQLGISASWTVPEHWPRQESILLGSYGGYWRNGRQ